MLRRSGNVFLTIILAAVFGAAGAQSPAPPTGAQKTAEQTFKNIQVLKGIPADELIPAMQFITASLGVECDFCHVRGHFDQDDKKPKQTARMMMRMMMAINQSSFEGHREVTCNTCHHGTARPVAIPAVDSQAKPEFATSNEEPIPPGVPSPDQIIDKYIQAVGGRKAIEAVTSRVETGTINVAGANVPIEIFNQAPDKRTSIMHLREGDSATIFDGRQGWLASPGHPPREMPGPEISGASLDADLHFPIDLKGLFSEIRSAPSDKIDDHEAYQLIASNKNQPPVHLYFDKESGLLVRLVRFVDTPLGWNPIRIDYADYAAVTGVKTPRRWTLARPAGQFTIQINEIKQNVAIDKTKFLKPPDPAQAK